MIVGKSLVVNYKIGAVAEMHCLDSSLYGTSILFVSRINRVKFQSHEHEHVYEKLEYNLIF